MITEQRPSSPDPFECPLPEIEIAPKTEVTITSARASSVGNLRPITIQLDAELAESLLVHDVKIGKNSQLCCVGAVPGTLFRRVPSPIPVFLDIIPSGLSMSLRVSNTTDRPVTFRGSLLATRRPLGTSPMAMVGFGVTKVVAGKSNIVVRSQLALKPRYLHVPPKVLEAFEIVSLSTLPYLDAPGSSGVDPDRLTHQSLLTSGGQIAFEPISTLTLDDSVVLRVKNCTNVDRIFSAVMLGEVVG